MLLITHTNLETKWKGTTQGTTIRMQGSLGTILEAAYHHNKIKKNNAWTNDESVLRSNYVYLKLENKQINK